jgi:hypothetical protein
VNDVPSIHIDKQVRVYADGAWTDDTRAIVGSPLFFRFVVTNDGPVDLEDVRVIDPALGSLLMGNPLFVFCEIEALDAGETLSCSPVGPIAAAFTGFDPHANTAAASGCAAADHAVCVEHEDTASYIGLHWAFTAGFWKNHTERSKSGQDAWALTSYDETTDVCSVFAGASDFVPCRGLLKTLSTARVGKGDAGAARILLRAGITALLNASFHETQHGGVVGPYGEVYYPLTSAGVVALVDEALSWPGGGQTDPADGVFKSPRRKMLEVSGLLQMWNEGIHFIDWDDPASIYLPGP